MTAADDHGLGLSPTVNAHVRSYTEIDLTRQSTGAHVLQVGSTAADSPSRCAVILYFGHDGADLRRLRDAISAHLGDDPAPGGTS